MVSQNAIIAALLSTGFISLVPNVLLLSFPRYARGEGEHSSILALGQAMAAGGLLGDVFLHTIPHANGGGNHVVGLWLLLGFTIFLVADMLLRSLSGGSGHDHNHHQKQQQSHTKKTDDHNHHLHEEQQLKTSAVLLNLAADAMHNFTDGLAIGASFSMVVSSEQDDDSVLSLLKSRGGLATLSILLHEIPHELGDFAILVKNGYSKNQAIMAQFGTALAAMAGTVVGILMEGFAGEALIYVTAGGFVYLAACTILPELLQEQATLTFRLAQLLFFGAGIAFLYAVSVLEELDHHHHGGHGGGHGHHGHDHLGHGHSNHVDEFHQDSHAHLLTPNEEHGSHDHHDHHQHGGHAHDHHDHSTGAHDHYHHEHHDGYHDYEL